MYEVTKKFTNGILKGMTHTEKTNVPYVINRTYRAVYGSDYKVIKIICL